MALSIHWIKPCKRHTKGKVNYVGQPDWLLSIEKEILSGEMPCPYKVGFRNIHGRLVCEHPLPLTVGGKSRIDLFPKPGELG